MKGAYCMENNVAASAVNASFDLLDRQGFIDQVIAIATGLSEKRQASCYAINGAWGVGKSFVLDRLITQANDIGVEGEELPRFLIFRYNCWEYDYYKEPLLAIVASMLDQINETNNLLSLDTKARVKNVLKTVGKGFLKIGAQVIKEKTGIDTETALELSKGCMSSSKDAIINVHEYDQYFEFKKNLQRLKSEIESLSRDQTILFIVDELDRCLPEYTIKVMERLHHLFEGVNNVQIILSVDERQLEHTVNQIYGNGTDANRYLKKFIGFELRLNEGVINNHFDDKFGDYTKQFDAKYQAIKLVDVEDFKSYCLNKQDMRTRISIIERCALVHSLLPNDNILDLSYMCLEMLLVILNDYGIDTPYAKARFNISSVFIPASLSENKQNSVPPILNYLSNKYKNNKVSANNSQKLFDHRTEFPYTTNYINAGCLLGRLLCAYRHILGFDNDTYLFSGSDTEIQTFVEYGEKYWDLLQIIR